VAWTTLALDEDGAGTRVLVGAVLLLAGVALLVTAWLGATERLPRNRFVGVRTRRSLSGDAAWRAANKAAAPAFYAAGGVLLLAAVLGAALPGEAVRSIVSI
uniref:SdpI family protein n=1 Tax=Streptomyces sp. NRRL S-1896 TaxID=1463893 RepID=UPI0007C68F84